ncbi:hypothetical protein LSAT2_029416, partial [Lamellibrachia satsuma]
FLVLAALVATVGSDGVKGEDPSTVDVEHPCGGSAVVERPATATVKSAVKAEDVARLLTRALHRVNDIKATYASQRLRSVFVIRMLENIAIPDLNPKREVNTQVRNKLAFREMTYDKEVSQLQWNVLMPIACSLEQITTSRGISLDASAIQ